MIGPATITRISPEPFRIAEVSKTGKLTLTTEIALTNGSADGNGGAILNHCAVTLTGSSLSGNTATANGRGIATVSSTATTLTETAVTTNHAALTAGGVYRQGGTMITNGTPISANTANNCVGSAPAVPTCTG